VFDSDVERSKWLSFTATLHGTDFVRLVGEATGNVPGEGGLITFRDSGWLMSIVIPFQPHFIDQPADVAVVWGYGLNMDAPGDFVAKPMTACTGQEIMTELLGQLRITAEAPAILASTTCISCLMPYITSQFMPRVAGDRPQPLPAGWPNLGFIGQFVELPEDVVFTVEYSIRSAQVAVYGLLGLDRAPPPVYRGAHDPRVLYRAFWAMHDMPA
jgi:oleate hydratase